MNINKEYIEKRIEECNVKIRDYYGAGIIRTMRSWEQKKEIYELALIGLDNNKAEAELRKKVRELENFIERDRLRK